jgi:hypothetical protein
VKNGIDGFDEFLRETDRFLRRLEPTAPGTEDVSGLRCVDCRMPLDLPPDATAGPALCPACAKDYDDAGTQRITDDGHASFTSKVIVDPKP